jgi:hypothetical protein
MKKKIQGSLPSLGKLERIKLNKKQIVDQGMKLKAT